MKGKEYKKPTIGISIIQSADIITLSNTGEGEGGIVDYYGDFTEKTEW